MVNCNRMEEYDNNNWYFTQRKRWEKLHRKRLQLEKESKEKDKEKYGVRLGNELD